MVEKITFEKLSALPKSTMSDKEISEVRFVSKDKFDELTDNEKTIIQVVKNINRISTHEEVEICGVTVSTKNKSLETYFNELRDLLDTCETIKSSPMPSAIYTERATWIKKFNGTHDVEANETDLWACWSIVSLFKAEEDGFDFEQYSVFEDIAREICKKYVDGE